MESLVQSSENKLTSINQNKLHGYEWFKSIGSPKYMVAPMVDQSELPYRMLTRRYGAQLCWTPMFHARIFATDEKYRKRMFKPCAEDRPLVVQFAANDPDYLLQAAKFVQDDCDAVDINCGCPQGIAKRGNYGAYLLEQADVIISLVERLHKELKVPVTVKIRCLKTEEQTLTLVKRIEAAGASMVTVHGRLKEHNKERIMGANYDIIRSIKQTLKIPVIANGGISTFKDVESSLELTGCDGVMSSEAILEYPALYDPSQIYDMDKLCTEYFQMVDKYQGEAELSHIRGHLFKFLHQGLSKHTDLRAKLGQAKGLEALKEVAHVLAELRINDSVESKIGWYYRHWKGMNLDVETTATFSTQRWDEQCKLDWRVNGELQEMKKQRKIDRKQQEALIETAKSLDEVFVGTNVHTNFPELAAEEIKTLIN